MFFIKDKSLLDRRFKNGMLILPWYYCEIMGKLNEQKFSGEGMKPKPFWKRMLNLSKQWRNFITKKKDILIFTSTLFNTRNSEGKYFNMLHGYYYDLFPNDTLMIEDGDMNNEWRETDLYPCTSYINSLFIFLSTLLAKLSSMFFPYNNGDYDALSKEYPDWISNKEIERMDHFSGIYEFFIKKLIKRVNPKVIIINCGSYGQTLGCICKVAHEMNIIIIETQHGLVYNHVVYSAPEFLKNSNEYMQYLPDSIFTFGDFWNSCIDWPYEKISVGNPFLNDYAPKYANSVEYTQDILVISQPNFKDLQTSFIRNLSKLLPSKIINIRLHPIEKIDTQQKLYVDCKNIHFSDSSRLLYEDMCSSKYVVGWSSTCLYELLAFKRKPFIVDSEISRRQMHQDVGIWVKSAEDMAQYVKEGYSPEAANYETFWKRNFNKNVSTYIETIVQKPS